MSYCSSSEGYVEFKRDLTDTEMDDIHDVLDYWFNISDIDHNSVLFDGDGNYYTDGVTDALYKLQRIAPIKEGILSYTRDDDSFWRYIYNGRKWIKQHGEIVYQDCV